ncbi:MAG: replicative DNA helicase [Xanthomonadales bacterium]|nr:replicative DNA helicase [Xanthomonadales bacterium]
MRVARQNIAVERAGRVLPQNIDAEESVLGGVLLKNDALDELPFLAPDHFYREKHRKIFGAMGEIAADNEPIDLVTLGTALKDSGDLESVGGESFLAYLAGRVPTAANVVYYGRLVWEKAILRELIDAATAIAVDGYETDERAVEAVAQAQARISRIAETGVSTRLVKADQLAPRGLCALEAEHEAYRAGGVVGIPTGFWDVDSLLAGLKPQDYVILAARPSMGKTSLALQVAVKAAMAGFPAFIASLEMSAEKLFTRALSLISDIPITHLRRDEDDHGRPLDAVAVIEAASTFGELPVWIDDSGAQRPTYIRSIARQVRRKSKADMGLIVVDHLNIAVADAKGQNRNHDLTEISAAMKALAKDIGWPVLALCQLSRKCEERTDKRPMLSDLRESGALEQDADIVMGLYREAYYNEHCENPRKAELIVLKNRDGECRTIPLHWDGRKTKFSDWSSL